MTANLIEAELDKRYGAVRSLAGARLAVRAGTIHALVGENGAGKSTLVKILAGVVPADRGRLAIAGTEIALGSWNRVAARDAGIGIVQQHGSSAGTLTVVENAVLGREPGGFVVDLAPASTGLARIAAEAGLAVEPRARAGELGLGAAQRAEIAAALYHEARVLLLDEPTAVLTPGEVEQLFATLRELARAGTTIVIVTHKLDEVRAIADDVTVLRAGATVGTFTAPLEIGAIARAMVGGEPPPPAPVPVPVSAAARPALAIRGPLELVVHAGELVGVAGVDGNGQRELAQAIAGLARGDGYTIELAGVDVTQASPRARLARGLAHIAEDRHHGGLLLGATVADNLALGRTDVTGRWRVDHAAVRRHAEQRIADIDLRPADPDAIAGTLSGGNQQKIVVARELSRPALRAVLAVQPTRGVDLGAVAKIHDQLRAAAARGAGVLVISADLDEMLALCHRIVVLLRGRIVGELAGDRLRESTARSALGAMMTGVTGKSPTKISSEIAS